MTRGHLPNHGFHCLQNMPLQALKEIIQEATIPTAEHMQRLEQQLRDTQAKLAAAEGAIKVIFILRKSLPDVGSTPPEAGWLRRRALPWWVEM